MTAPTHIHELPTEILHLIASHITSLSRAKDLANLSLVSQRWRSIAQEALLTTPVFDILLIHQYTLQLLYHPEARLRVRTLEIRSKSRRQIVHLQGGRTMDQYAPITASDTVLQREHFTPYYLKIIELFTESERDRKNWAVALTRDGLPALLGILICILPNLKEFKCGNGWLMDFALLTMSMHNEQQIWPTRPSVDFLSKPLEILKTQIEVLEMPANMSGMIYRPRDSAIFDFRGFTRLRDLGLSFSVLCGFPVVHQTLPSPKFIFPPTLEILRISEGLYNVTDFLSLLFLDKKRGFFPELYRIEVFFEDDIEYIVSEARVNRVLDPILHLPRMAADAEVELYMYFPHYSLHTWKIGGTPWRLKQEGLEVLQIAEDQAYFYTLGYTPFGFATDMEWEHDGDVVMK
ncbi:hypothetical protein EKO04_000994 [Ascochyta lentis]|uniref:F-box domain-containing protein n=1 Tax=Ascochyta lentis TaxID=205686 RepID=A0A8H7MHX0_9PLEO|nr:hypothetical protein EKO04_000994 [Ascochyta lentis]